MPVHSDGRAGVGSEPRSFQVEAESDSPADDGLHPEPHTHTFFFFFDIASYFFLYEICSVDKAVAEPNPPDETISGR